MDDVSDAMELKYAPDGRWIATGRLDYIGGGRRDGEAQVSGGLVVINPGSLDKLLEGMRIPPRAPAEFMERELARISQERADAYEQVARLCAEVAWLRNDR